MAPSWPTSPTSRSSLKDPKQTAFSDRAASIGIADRLSPQESIIYLTGIQRSSLSSRAQRVAPLEPSSTIGPVPRRSVYASTRLRWRVISEVKTVPFFRISRTSCTDAAKIRCSVILEWCQYVLEGVVFHAERRCPKGLVPDACQVAEAMARDDVGRSAHRPSRFSGYHAAPDRVRTTHFFTCLHLPQVRTPRPHG